MRCKLLLSYTSALVIVVGCKGQSHQFLDEKQLLSEIEQLRSDLIANHPGLHWFASEEDIDGQYDLLTDRIREGVDLPEYYRSICQFVASIKCGHTRITLPPELEATFYRSYVMPFTTVIDTDQVFVDISKTPQLQPGDRILSINDWPIGSILAKMRQRLPGDGFITSGKDHYLSRTWPYQYAKLLDHTSSSFKMEVIRNDRTLLLEVPGRIWQDLRSEVPARRISSSRLLDLTMYEDLSLAVMTIRTFASGSLDGYEEFLRSSFSTLNDRSIEYLILDLRGNGGGRDQFGALLVSYFADRPFNYFESIEVTKDYSGWGGVVARDGRRWVTSHSGLSQQTPAANRFSGKAFVLIDGGCFSTCGDVTSVLKSYGFAEMIGVETGGGAYGNTSGMSGRFKGAYSGVEVSIPYWLYRTAHLPAGWHGQGVMPDWPLTPQFVSAEEDSFMTFVKSQLIGR